MSLRFLPWAPPCSSFFHYSDVPLLIILLPGGSRIITVTNIIHTTFLTICLPLVRLIVFSFERHISVVKAIYTGAWDTRVNREDLRHPRGVKS